MFSLRVLVGKAIAEEEKKWKAQKSSVQKTEFGYDIWKRIRPNKLIEEAKSNLNKIKIVRYGFAPKKL